MNLPTKFDPVLFDNPPNVEGLGYNAAFVHDAEVKCDAWGCRNTLHFRLLNLDKEVEVKDVPTRIEAMRNVWHGLEVRP